MSEGVSDLMTLANADLTVEIAALGAELVRLRDREGRDYLWNGDPAFWKGRAPLLFPMVGRAAGDVIRVNGAATPLPQHGFARVSRFECMEASATRCRTGFPDMPHLGVWTKPGAPFICVEPWQGFASAAGYDGEFVDRPGVVSIAPKAERSFHMTISLDASRRPPAP
jgi:galactose mutarotase-like enzyme